METMHGIGEKNKYVGLLFMKATKEYFDLGEDGIRQVSAGHARDLAQYANQLTHVVCSGMHAKYDQVTMIEADTLEEIYAAHTAFRMGAKGKYIDIVDIVVGIKAPPRSQ